MDAFAEALPLYLCSRQVATASCAGTACVNSFGDEQLAIDMLADKILFDSLKHSVSLPTHKPSSQVTSNGLTDGSDLIACTPQKQPFSTSTGYLEKMCHQASHTDGSSA